MHPFSGTLYSFNGSGLCSFDALYLFFVCLQFSTSLLVSGSVLGVAGLCLATAVIAIFQYASWFVREVHGLEPYQYSLIVMLGGGVGIIGNVVGGRLGDRFGRRRVGAIAFALLPLGAAVFFFGPTATLWLGFALTVFLNSSGEVMLRALDDSASFGQTLELCGPDIYSLEEILRFLCRELSIRRAIFNLPGPLGRLQAWVGEYLLPGKPFSRDNYRSLTVASVCRDNGFAAFDIEPKRMQPIVSSYISGGRDELAIIRQSSHR